MLQPADYVRAARYLVECYGPSALQRAEKRAEALRGEGADGVHALWSVLVATIAAMTAAPTPR